jgi:hypothetical protein
MGRSSTLRPPSSGLTYREARELCNELMTRVQVSTRTYRWRRYDDVFSSGEAVNALLSFQQAQLTKLAENEAQAASQLQTLMDFGFIGRVSKKNDELTGLNEKHANVIKVTNHTYYRFRKQELSSWQLRVEVLEVRSSAGVAESGSVRLGVAGQAHDLSVKRISTERIATYAPESSSGDAFLCGVDFERDDGRDLGVPYGAFDSCPSDEVVGGFFFAEEAIRCSAQACGRLRLREGSACRAGVGCVAVRVEEGRHGPAEGAAAVGRRRAGAGRRDGRGPADGLRTCE